ncbi:MAG: hypothetical protein MJ252_17145 [archaeon]|nr:hypothetical protein [archaeon]
MLENEKIYELQKKANDFNLMLEKARLAYEENVRIKEILILNIIARRE